MKLSKCCNDEIYEFFNEKEMVWKKYCYRCNQPCIEQPIKCSFCGDDKYTEGIDQDNVHACRKCCEKMGMSGEPEPVDKKIEMWEEKMSYEIGFAYDTEKDGLFEFMNKVFPKLQKIVKAEIAKAQEDCKGKLKHLSDYYEKRIKSEIYLAKKEERERIAKIEANYSERSEAQFNALQEAKREGAEEMLEIVSKGEGFGGLKRIVYRNKFNKLT